MRTLLASVASQLTHSTKEIIMIPSATISHQKEPTHQSRPPTQGSLTKPRSIRAFNLFPSTTHRALMTQGASAPRREVYSPSRIVTIRLMRLNYTKGISNTKMSSSRKPNTTTKGHTFSKFRQKSKSQPFLPQ